MKKILNAIGTFSIIIPSSISFLSNNINNTSFSFDDNVSNYFSKKDYINDSSLPEIKSITSLTKTFENKEYDLVFVTDYSNIYLLIPTKNANFKIKKIISLENNSLEFNIFNDNENLYFSLFLNSGSAIFKYSLENIFEKFIKDDQSEIKIEKKETDETLKNNFQIELAYNSRLREKTIIYHYDYNSDYVISTDSGNTGHYIYSKDIEPQNVKPISNSGEEVVDNILKFKENYFGSLSDGGLFKLKLLYNNYWESINFLNTENITNIVNFENKLIISFENNLYSIDDDDIVNNFIDLKNKNKLSLQINIQSLRINDGKLIASTEEGVFLLNNLDFENKTFDIEKISNDIFSNIPASLTKNGIYFKDKEKNTIGYIRKYISISDINSEIKIALENSILATGNENEIFLNILNKLISKTNILNKMTYTELISLIDISDVLNLKVESSLSKWYEEANIIIDSSKGFIKSGDTLKLIVSSHEQNLDFIKNETLDINLPVIEGLIDDEEKLNEIYDEVENQLLKKGNKYLKVDRQSSLTVKKDSLISINLKTIDGLTLINDQNSLSTSILLNFKNVSIPVDIEEIRDEINSLNEISTNLLVTSSEEEFIEKLILNLQNSDKNKANYEIENFENKLSYPSFKAVIILTDPVTSKKIETNEITFKDITKEPVELFGKFNDKSFNNGFIIGESSQYIINDNENNFSNYVITSSNQEVITASQISRNEKIFNIDAVGIGKAQIIISAQGAKNNITLNLEVFENQLTFLGLDNGSPLHLNEGEIKKYELKNPQLIDQSSLVIENDNKDFVDATIEDDYLVLTALKESQETLNLKIKAKTIRGNDINFLTFDINVDPPKVFPMWAIILISLLFFVAILIVTIYLLWNFYFKFKFNNRIKGNYSKITIHNKLNQKAKSNNQKKSFNDNGIKRSGLFERELEYNKEKFNDPNYESKYIWLQETELEDNSPVLNNWDRPHSDKKINKKK